MPHQSARPPERLDTSARWDPFFAGLEALARTVDADGFSLGVVQDLRICTYNLGFSRRTSSAYAVISLAADLPGPAVLRTRSAQYLETASETRSRFPDAAPIHEGTAFEAAACVPLASRDGSTDLGYLALHFTGARTFSPAYRSNLAALTRPISSGLGRLLHAISLDGASADGAPRADGAPPTLQEAMQSRAQIEQARGVLMELHGLGPVEAGEVIRARAAESGQRVLAVARDILASVHDEG